MEMSNEIENQTSNPDKEVRARKKLTEEEREAAKKRKERIRAVAAKLGMTEEDYMASRRKKRNAATSAKEAEPAITEVVGAETEPQVESQAEPQIEPQVEPQAESPILEEPTVEELPMEELPMEELPVVESEKDDIKIMSTATQEEVIRLDEMEGNEIKEFWEVCRSVMWVGLTNPIEAVRKEGESKYQVKAVFGIALFFLVFIATSIHVPVLQPILSLIDRMQIGAGLVTFMGIIFVLLTALVYAFAKKNDPSLEYKSVTGAYCITFIPGIFMFCLIFLLGYLSVAGTLLFVVINFGYWILLSSQLTTYYLEGDTVKSNIIMMIVSVVLFFIVYFTIKLGVLQILTEIIDASAGVIQSSDGSVVGSTQSIVEELISFLRDVDTLLGTGN